MIKLQPNETELTGSWLLRANQVRRDAISERIECLISQHLQKVEDSPQWGAWETLYRDPDDGRYWERTFPQSELQGGGPPRLKCLTIEEAKKKYGDQLVKG